MAYIVLARRWRPQQFEDIIAQDHVAQTLANSIDSQRIAHSFIFAGPRGVGKTTTARILAKALNCEKGPTKTPCNKCAVCESITKGTSMDVLEIDGASNRGIDEIRNLRENIRFTPSLGKYRIYIIDEVHMLTKEAFNALLKTLEEPPQHAIFIFATTEIHRVPPTILSRCQRFDFKRIPVKIIMEHLQRMCDTDGIKIENDALLQIAKKADGSMRDAQSILDQMISYSGENITADQVSQALGIIDLELFFDFTNKIRQGDLKELLIMCQKINSEGYDLGEFLSGFEEHFRNILVTKTLGNVDLINVPEHFNDAYLREGENFQVNDLLLYIQYIGELQTNLKWAPHPQLKFELALLKMAKLPATVDLENILEKLDLIKKKVSHQNNPINNTTSDNAPAEESKAELNISNIKQYWPQLIDHFKESKVNLANAIELGKPVKLQNSQLTIQYNADNAFHVSWLNKNKRLVEEKLVTHFKKPARITVTMVEKKGSTAKTTDNQKSKKVINKMIKEDPLLNKLIDDLGLELT
jgi:DNA polymerase-3 subunit gamma/tau